MRNSAIKKLDTLAPVLNFGDNKKRAWSYLWQGLGIVGIAAMAASMTLSMPTLMEGFLLIAGFFATIIGAASFLYDRYANDFRTSAVRNRDNLIRNIRKAAEDTLDKPNRDIELAHYITTREFISGLSADKEYVASLSPRHIRWAQRQYQRQLKLVAFERSAAKQIFADEVSANTAALNVDTGVKEQAREMAYYLKALDDVASGKSRPLTEVERFEREFNKA